MKKDAKKKKAPGHRVTVTVDAEVIEQLDRRSGTLTRSDLVNEACRRVFLTGGMESALEAIHRNLLEGGTRQRKLELRQQIQLETVLVLARAWFAVTPDIPEEEKRAAGAVADLKLSRLMDAIAETVGRSTSVLGRSIRLEELLFGVDATREGGTDERTR